METTFELDLVWFAEKMKELSELMLQGIEPDDETREAMTKLDEALDALKQKGPTKVHFIVK